jgi:hypothetical protein
MTRSLDHRLAKLEAQGPATAADQRTADRVVASRLLLEEALGLMKQANQLLATTKRHGLWNAPLE